MICTLFDLPGDEKYPHSGGTYNDNDGTNRSGTNNDFDTLGFLSSGVWCFWFLIFLIFLSFLDFWDFWIP